METIEKRVEHIRNCYESFVENCGIRHHTFADIWFHGPKYFLWADCNSGKYLRRECITLYLQFANILDVCEQYGVTDEDLDYSFYLKDMKNFIETYKCWVDKQFNNPDTIL